jgi:Na+-driven multidrug efflux pump
MVNDSQQATSLSKFIILRAFQAGAVLVTVLSILLYMFRSNVISVLTKSADIQAAALDAFPVFLLAQRKYPVRSTSFI